MALTRAILPAKLLLCNAYCDISRQTSWNSSIKLLLVTTNDLKEWCHGLSTWNGRIAVLCPHDIILKTDTSLSGWGVSLSCWTLMAAGWWSSDNSKSHINILELATVHNTILALQPHLQGKVILMQCDNIVTVAHLNHMGRQSIAMNRVWKEIHLLCERLCIQLLSAYLPGLCNSEANHLSCLHPHHEWHLLREAFELIDKKWGPHSIDWTATRENRQLPQFNLRFMEVDGKAMDCLLQNWRNDNNWTAPPITLIPRILDLVERQGATATIMAPIWLGCRWASHLQRLSINSLVQIPTSSTSFTSRFNSTPKPLHNKQWRWAAFRISGCPTQLDGPQPQPTCSTRRSRHPPGVNTLAISAASATTA